MCLLFFPKAVLLLLLVFQETKAAEITSYESSRVIESPVVEELHFHWHPSWIASSRRRQTAKFQAHR
jgi:hypothetical protein